MHRALNFIDLHSAAPTIHAHGLGAVVCVLASGILVSLGRRIVGGVIGDWTGWAPPHLLACAAWGAAVGFAALLGSAPWWGAIAVGVGAWLGHIVTGLNNSAGMGHFGDRNELWKLWGFGYWVSQVDGKVHRKPGGLLSYLGLSAYGTSIAAAAVALTFCPEAHGVWWIELLAGLAIAPAYAFSWFLFRRKPVGWPVGCNPPLASSEWIAGFLLGALACLGFTL